MDIARPYQPLPLSPVMVLLTVAIAAFGGLLSVVTGNPAMLLWTWLAALIGMALVVLTYFGDVLWLMLVQFFLVACLHEEFWRLPIAGFFSPTIPRISMVVIAGIWLLMAVLGRLRYKPTGVVLTLMGVMLIYFTLSYASTGFQYQTDIATPHYRLIGGYLFPFITFFLFVQAIHRERQLKAVLVFFFVFGLYLTFTGIMEVFNVHALIWPSFIANPNIGIHYGRARGPFLVSAVMGLTLVYIFYNNLLLARYLRGINRAVVLAVQPAVVFVIFNTATRSVWTSFLVGGAIWLLYTRSRITRLATVTMTAAIVVVGAYAYWDNISSENRFEGGWTDREPIYARIGLAVNSIAMWADNPLFGVGFGRFRDFIGEYLNDPADKYQRFSARTLEHNNLLGLLATTGIVGASLYIALLILLFRESLRLWRRLPSVAAGFWSRDFVVLYWVMFANFLIDGTFRETSIAPFANSLFFGLSGIIVAMNRLLDDKPLPPRLPPLPRSWGPGSNPLVPATGRRNGNGNGNGYGNSGYVTGGVTISQQPGPTTPTTFT